MSGGKFSPSIPRRMYWSDDVGGCASCPECAKSLESDPQAYVAVTRRRGEMDFHMVGNSAGHFCADCPVVVLDREEFDDDVYLAVGDADGVDYSVMGIFDRQAVPKDKQGLPFDDATNPIPLVGFTNTKADKPSAKSISSRPRKRKRGGRKKRGR